MTHSLLSKPISGLGKRRRGGERGGGGGGGGGGECDTRWKALETVGCRTCWSYM